MTKDLVLKFLLTAIDKTKSGRMRWEKTTDKEWVEYTAKYNGGNFKIMRSLADDDLDIMVSPDGKAEQSLLVIDDDVDHELESMAFRLHNLVYTIFPNPEKFLEDFINDPE